MKARYLLLALLAATLLPWARGAWAGGGTPVMDSRLAGAYHALGYSGGAFATAIDITTRIPATSAADGEYLLDVTFGRRDTTTPYSARALIHFDVASGALNSTPRALVSTSGLTLTSWKISSSGGYFHLHIGSTVGTACDLNIVAYTRVANAAQFFTGWTVADGATAGTSVFLTATIPSALAISGALSGATTGAFSSSVDIGGNITMNNAGSGVQAASADASDSQVHWLAGGGSNVNTRGAYANAYGNEHATNPGILNLVAGEAGSIALWTGSTATKRVELDTGGNISLNGPLVFASPQPAAPAPSPGMRTIFHDNVSGGLGFSTSGNFSFYGATGGEILRHSATVWRLLSGYWELSTANTASAPAGTVRNINPNGTATDLGYNVPTGGTHRFTVNGNPKVSLDTASLTSVVDINACGIIAMPSPAAAPAGSVRSIHPNGSTTDMVFQIPSAGAFRWWQNGAAIAYLDNAIQTFGVPIRMDAAAPVINTNTSDGSDTKQLAVASGGAADVNRGGWISTCGNEHSTRPGMIDFYTGDVAGALWRVYTGASVLRLSIDRNGLQTSACGQVNSWTTKTGNYTMQATDYGVVVDATSSSLNITLPTNSAGRTVHIKRVDSSGNTVTLIPPSGNIRGAANITLSASFAAGYEAILIGNGGSQWY